MKLCVYTIDGLKVGLDITSWDDSALNGNDAFIIVDDNATIPTPYVDISSIENWFSFSPDEKLGHMEALDLGISIGYANLTDPQKAIVDELEFYYTIYRYIYKFNTHDDTNIKIVPLDIQYSVDEAPYNLDYDVVGLHKRQFFVKGELLKVEYYGEYDSNTQTYSRLCIVENRVYNRQNGFLFNRAMQIDWYKSDGTVGATKNTLKYYNTFDAIIAGNNRRDNIINEIKIVVVGLIQMTQQISLDAAQAIGKDFLTAISSNVTLYIKGNEQELLDQITTDTTFAFLDNVITMAGTNAFTIRMYILDALTIDYSKVYTMNDQSPFSFFNTI